MQSPEKELTRFYAEVDRLADRLNRRHASRLQCGRGCSDCCIDGLSVFEIEADNIRQHHRHELERSVAHPTGRCAFLDGEGACRIYASRPYVCRTQGLPIRWLEEQQDTLVELRDICPLNEEGQSIESLAESECWTIGPFEGQLAGIQECQYGSLRRVPLRQLFEVLSQPS